MDEPLKRFYDNAGFYRGTSRMAHSKFIVGFHNAFPRIGTVKVQTKQSAGGRGPYFTRRIGASEQYCLKDGFVVEIRQNRNRFGTKIGRKIVQRYLRQRFDRVSRPKGRQNSNREIAYLLVLFIFIVGLLYRIHQRGILRKRELVKGF